MFGIFKNGKVQLNVALDRQVYAPGDTINARITVQNDKEINIQGGHFVVTCQQKYQFRRETSDSEGDTTVKTTWGKNDTQVFTFDFLPQLSLPPDTHTFEASIKVEEGALPTSKGEIVSTAWFAKAKIDRKLAPDANSEVDFTVVTLNPPNMRSATTGQYGTSNEPAEAQLTYLLQTKEISGGAVLSGSLRILPHKDFGVSEVRLEFARDEYVADVSKTGCKNKKETPLVKVKLAGKTQLQAGQLQEFPFTLQTPPALAPSMQFAAGSLKYKLKAILARMMRKDTLVEEEILVYSGGG